MGSSKMSGTGKHIFFGPYKVAFQSIFYESPLSYGIVNLKPIMPGHVMVIPKRVLPRFADLTPEEVSDIYLQVWKIVPVLEKHYGATGLNAAMQDGKSAGQSVPHVHVHILPRKDADFERNDEVYEKLEEQKLNDVFAEENRRIRTEAEMAAEASELKALFNEDNWP